ncbi:MAG: hypothetical protein COU51_01355 [Parcubacteria group bacterium CG10_big_fil_rev_8_21_14_0_10_36_14]|nr:MAG: hypothetical protein COU51_01355 [Parcubacteria group bacterium CG10_big_fil_rev_8_21_14_0_10_36_14]
MLFTTHAITGATIGFLTGNPILGFFGGWLSHHILDALPHFDQGSFYMEKDNGPTWLGACYKEKKKKFKIKRDWIILLIDISVTLLIALYFAANIPVYFWPPMIFGAIGGLFPDILDTSPFWKDKFRKTRIGFLFHKVHSFFHWPLSMQFFYIGFGLQILIVAIDLFILSSFF